MNRTRTTAVLVAAGAAWAASAASAQDLEPHRWTHLPVGTHIVGVGYAYTTGDLTFDPVLRIDDVDMEMHSAVAMFNRYFAVGDLTARVDVQLPVQSGRWSGTVDGAPRTVRRDGMGDPRLRLSLNFLGSPALEGEAWGEYQRGRERHAVAGVGVAVRLPLGEYMDDKLINLGEHRYSFQPQVGFVQTEGPWSFELTGSAFLYTRNDDFFGGNTLDQDPLFAVQTHVVRTFDAGWWVSAGGAYGRGGESEINGEEKDDRRSNLLYGICFGLPLGSGHSVRADYLRQDALKDLGLDAHSVLLSWALRF